MIFLKVLNGAQSGSVIELNDATPYVVSNNFDNDIFLDIATKDLKQSGANVPSDDYSGVLFALEVNNNFFRCLANPLGLLRFSDGKIVTAANANSSNDSIRLPVALSCGIIKLLLDDNDGIVTEESLEESGLKNAFSDMNSANNSQSENEVNMHSMFMENAASISASDKRKLNQHIKNNGIELYADDVADSDDEMELTRSADDIALESDLITTTNENGFEQDVSTELSSDQQGTQIASNKKNRNNDNYSNINANNRWQQLIIKLRLQKVAMWLNVRFSYIANLLAKLRSKNPIIFYSVIAVATLILILLVTITLEIHQQDTVAVHQEKLLSDRQEVQKELLHLPNKYANLKLIDEDNKPVIIGILQSDSDVTAIHKIFRHHKGLQLKVVAYDAIQNKIIDILRQHNLPSLRLNFMNNDAKIALIGLIGNMSDLDDAEIAINNQFPMIGELDTTSVFLVTDFYQELTQTINHTNLANRLKIEADYNNSKVVINGYLTANEQNFLRLSLAPLQQKYQNIITIDFNIKDVMSALPFKIAEVYSGNPSYLVTQSGEKIFIGGEVAGITVSSINQNQITFGGRVNVVLRLSDIATYNQALAKTNNKETQQLNNNDAVGRDSAAVSYISNIDNLTHVGGDDGDEVANSNNDDEANTAITSKASITSKATIGGKVTIQNQSNNNSNTMSLNNIAARRVAILHNELLNEQTSLSKERLERSKMSVLLASANDTTIKSLLQEHIKNLDSDIAIKEHELQFYSTLSSR